ncbi:putative forkhead associated domain containing protein [Lyophyllum shimeji]|uniref:Forkhead associated domain containing protein n=1 Tax=Lyophyllum shimeji TaxID=47721 RepID=A0A9P3PRV0_LYOSH|nr:putative forkhead associated domain containing protein [Lyophyllum shimeji]
MDSEEGEIYEPRIGSSHISAAGEAHDPSFEWPGEAHDPAYEWPGDPSSTPSPYQEPLPPSEPVIALRPNQPTFRLIVLRTSILPSKHRLAVVDGYSEIQFGRDVPAAGSTTPKIRLKEMEVSKIHATAYWDASRREWGVVDMGSVHGTYLQPASASGDDRGVRLSPPRQASIPRKLGHMDRLTIGGTTFLVHMHADHLPCEECWTSGKDEIPLFPVSKSSRATALEPLRATGAWDANQQSVSYTPKPPKDAKKALTMLKQSLLTRHGDASPRSNYTPPADAPAQYVDRSARRRTLMPTSHSDAPGVSSPSASIWVDSPPPRSRSPVIEPTSQPPAPLPSSNIGHRLLMKQGWEPGTALGSPMDPNEGRTGLLEPIEVGASVNRAGLGLKRNSSMSLPSLSDPDWKEAAKRRRWDRS